MSVENWVKRASLECNHNKVERPKRKTVLTLGGCNLVGIFGAFPDWIEHKHIWRVTVPSLMSEACVLHNTSFESPVVMRLAERESSKLVFDKVVQANVDVIAFEAGGDFTHRSLVLDDRCIMADFRTDVFGPEFKGVEFPKGSELSNAEVIDADNRRYWAYWKFYFDKFYREVLCEKIAAGTRVMFLSREQCIAELRDGALGPHHAAQQIGYRNELLREIDAFVAGYAGIEILKGDYSLRYTSKSAPFGGPWEFHPDNGYYAAMRQKMLDMLFPGKGFGERSLVKDLAEYDRRLDSLRSKNEGLDRRLKAVEQDAANLASDNDRLRREASALNDAMKAVEGSGGAPRESGQLSVNGITSAVEQLDAALEDCRIQRQQAEDLVSALRQAELERQALVALLSHRFSLSANYFRGLSGWLAVRYECRTMERAGFDRRGYLAANPDVGAANVDPTEHFVRYGLAEGRKVCIESAPIPPS